MRLLQGATRVIALLAIAFVVHTPADAHAQEQAKEQNDAWHTTASIYMWLPGIEGATSFPSGASGPSLDVEADTLIENLDFTFMAALDLQQGQWGLFTDLIYLNEGASESGTRELTVGGADLPANVTADARLDLKSWVWTVAGTWSPGAVEPQTAEFLLGTRMLDIDQQFDWTFNGDIGPLPLPGRSGTSEASGTNWDAIIGVKGHPPLGNGSKWFLPYHLDLGTGDSDFTWQAMAGIGYGFGWGSMVLSWRHLDYEFESDGALDDMTFSGPLLGASFRW